MWISILPSDLQQLSLHRHDQQPILQPEMPSNWQQIAATPSFALWDVSGYTVARNILNEGNAPGAVLDCRTSLGRRLSESRGVAGVWETPPDGPDASWSHKVPSALTPTPQGDVAVPTGSVLTEGACRFPPAGGRSPLSYPGSSLHLPI